MASEQAKHIAELFASLIFVGPSSALHRARLAPKRAAERSLADEFIDSWVCWREACGDVGSAYDRWATCNGSQRLLAFESYRAALDREEHAARVHSFWTERLQAAAR